MESEWVKCTLQAGKDKVVWVNLGAALTIAEHKGGSRIAFRVGEEDEMIDVKETPETLLETFDELEEQEEGEESEEGEEESEGEEDETAEETKPTADHSSTAA